MKSFENIELFQEAPPQTAAPGPLPNTNDQITGRNSVTGTEDIERGARADQANGARRGATALPQTAGENAVGQYGKNADAARAYGVGIAEADRDLVLQRLREQMLLMGDAIKNNTNMFRSIEQMKASFSGMAQIISIIARGLGATEFADDAMSMARALSPQPVYPDLSRLQGMRDTVTAGLPPEVRAGVDRAFDDAISIAGQGVTAAPAIGSDVVRGAGDVDPGDAITTPGAGGAPAAGSPGRITRAEWDARIGASGITAPALRSLFTDADANRDGALSQAEKVVLDQRLGSAPGVTAAQRATLGQNLTLDLTN